MRLYQGFEPRPPADEVEAFDSLVQSEVLPEEMRDCPPEEKRRFIRELLSQRPLMAQFFVRGAGRQAPDSPGAQEPRPEAARAGAESEAGQQQSDADRLKALRNIGLEFSPPRSS
jgi:hypothetical protein